jgi:DNA-binding NarL/FixJ family response regulator
VAEQGVEANPLTGRQVLVLELVATGLTNREIGARMGVTPQTVGLHLSRIYRAAGVSNRTAAVRWAERHRLFGAPTVE